MKNKLLFLAAALTIIVGCSDNDSAPSATLYGTWATDLAPLNHEGYSHSTFNSDGTYKLDMEFFVEGSDCFLDVATTGTFVANTTTLTVTHESGTQVVSQCSEEAYNQEEVALTQEKIDNYNSIGELKWSVEGDVLTLTDDADILRKYKRLYN